MSFKTSVANYFLQVSIAVDRLINAAILRGDAGETLSSVAYRKARDKARFGFMEAIIDKLFFEGHCHQAYIHDRAPVLKE